MVCESFGKADLLLDHFDSKQSVDVPLICYLFPSLITFVFRSSEVRRFLLDMDPNGNIDPSDMFLLFLKGNADIVHLGNFPASWRLVNVTPISKGPLPSSVANYQLISITSVLSMVFEHLVLVHLG